MCVVKINKRVAITELPDGATRIYSFPVSYVIGRYFESNNGNVVYNAGDT